MTPLLCINSWKLSFQVSWEILCKILTPCLFFEYHVSWFHFSSQINYWKLGFQVSWKYCSKISDSLHHDQVIFATVVLFTYSNARLFPVISGHPRPFPAIPGNFRPSPAIPVHPRPSPAIPGHPRPSPAIPGHPWPSPGLIHLSPDCMLHMGNLGDRKRRRRRRETARDKRRTKILTCKELSLKGESSKKSPLTLTALRKLSNFLLWKSYRNEKGAFSIASFKNLHGPVKFGFESHRGQTFLDSIVDSFFNRI